MASSERVREIAVRNDYFTIELRKLLNILLIHSLTLAAIIYFSCYSVERVARTLSLASRLSLCQMQRYQWQQRVREWAGLEVTWQNLWRTAARRGRYQLERLGGDMAAPPSTHTERARECKQSSQISCKKHYTLIYKDWDKSMNPYIATKIYQQKTYWQCTIK